MGPALALLLPAWLGWVSGWLVLGRIFFGSAMSPRRKAADARVTPRDVSIIIPARNEEANLARLLRSLHPAECVAQIIVVDDASSDRTAEVARAEGATVVASKPLPEGWRGKTWACFQGAGIARGSWLLFLDADTWVELGGLERIIEHAGEGVVSIAPFHVVERPYEELSLFFNLAMSAGTGAFAVWPDRTRGLFGQCLLISARDYRLAGGHETVRGRILENFWLASHLRSIGIPLRAVSGQGTLSFRMYPGGLGDLVAGWTKGFASGARQTARPELLLIIAFLSGMVSATISLAFGWSGAVIYVLYAVQLFVLARRMGRFHWWTCLFYPVPLLFYFAIFFVSVLRFGRSVSWKGRTIRAD